MCNIGVMEIDALHFLGSGSSLNLLLAVNPSLRALSRVEGITAQPNFRRDAYGGEGKDNLR